MLGRATMGMMWLNTGDVLLRANGNGFYDSSTLQDVDLGPLVLGADLQRFV